MSLHVNLVILNYRGRLLLERFIPSWIRSAEKSSYPCRVTVLDNGPEDGSETFVRSRYPGVAWVGAPENKVLCSYNAFAQAAAEDILILLNNDIETEEGFVDPLVEPFLKDPDVFFVATHGDLPIVRRRWGIFSAELDYAGYAERIEHGGAPFSAGIGAFDRKKFLELGGYDELFLPGRYEDVDLCYRGWKKGWIGVYAPQSRKKHLGGVSFNKAFTPDETQAMVFRNGILFMTKNITDPFFFILFVLGTFARVVFCALTLRKPYLEGFAAALGCLGRARRSRKEAQRHFTLSDRQVLKKVSVA